MSPNIGGTITTVAAAISTFISVTAHTAMAQSIQGTATYRERMALPPTAVFEATLEDVSRADAAAETIGGTRLTSPGNPPIKFAITYDPARVLADHRYVVRARILVNDQLLFSSDTATPVITHGSPTTVSIMMRRMAAAQNPSPGPASTAPLEKTYWRASELAGKPTLAQDAQREAHLVFETGGRLSGSDGCNRITGTYQLKGDAVTFGQTAATRMACIDAAADIERAFRDAVKRAMRLTIAGDRLDLFDAAGNRVASFTAGTRAATQPNPLSLAGTSWQLVQFRGGDGTTLTPDDRANRRSNSPPASN